MTAMTGFMEWLGRVIMLVLAGMITLSIIGAIASIPSQSIQTRLGTPATDWAEPRPSTYEPVPQATAPEPQPSASPAPAPRPQAGQVVAVPRPPEPVPAARWLESIAYALLALVGLAGFGILLLWRALHHWRRSADALETLAARRSA